MSEDLAARLHVLEAESAIRKLKARYLNACDAKDATAVRACFTADAVIDYPPLGAFDLDGLINVFTEMAVNSNIVDVHQGHNAEIEIDGDNASARWNLSYTMFDPDTKAFRLLASFYHDRYRLTDQGWLICYTRSEPRSMVDGTLDVDLKAQWASPHTDPD